MGKFAMNVKHFTLSNLYGLDRHNMRNTSNHTTNIDDELTKENLILKGNDSLAKLAKEQVKKRVSGRITSSSIFVSEFIFTLPENLKKENAEEYFRDCIDILEHMGNNKDNIVKAVVHLDEPDARPHCHVDFVPITRDGRLSRKDLFTRDTLKKLQYAIPEKLIERGWNIELPEKSRKGQYKKTVKELKKDLLKEIEDLKTEKAELEENNLSIAYEIIDRDREDLSY